MAAGRNVISISDEQRIAIVGTTGSGKTVLAAHLLSGLTRVVVIDPKHTFNLDGFKTGWQLPLFSKDYKLIVRPRRGQDERLGNLLYTLLGSGNLIIYVDELATMVNSYKLSVEVLEEIARTGRERHVGLWTATQRPAWIPKIFLTESETYIMFQLRTENDRKYMAGLMGDEVRLPIEKYQFWYLAPGAREPALLTYDLNRATIKTVD